MRVFFFIVSVIIARYGTIRAAEDEGQTPMNSSETDSIQTRATLSFDPNDVHFYLHTDKDHPTAYKEIVYKSKSSLRASGIVRDQPVKFVIHGFMSSTSEPPCTTIAPAYLSRGFKNVICVQWEDLAGPKYFIIPKELLSLPSFLTYPIMVKTGIITGNRVSQFLKFLLDNKIVPDPTYFHILGHSLGAHVAGAAGYNFTSTTGQKIGRISGLDPAGPIYKDLPLRKRLDPSDATFVDVIHTNKWEFGYAPPLGTVDFYANGGAGFAQPFCNKFSIVLEFVAIVCSHLAAIDYYVRSILGEKFIGCRCSPNYKIEKTGMCKKSSPCKQPERFGEYGSLKAKGSYFVRIKGNLSENSFYQTIQVLVDLIKDKEANKTLSLVDKESGGGVEDEGMPNMMDEIP